MYYRIIGAIVVLTVVLYAPVAPAREPSDYVLAAMPGLMPGYIEQRADPVTLKVGTIAADQIVMAVPFAYRTPIRAKNAFRTALDYIPAGAPGFDAGIFRGARGFTRLVCFFDRQPETPYADPLCLRQDLENNYLDKTFANPKYMAADTKGNLPEAAEPGFIVSEKVYVESTGVVIDHDFRLSLTVKKWDNKGAHVKWLSDGVVIQSETYPLNPQGQVVFAVNNGTFILKPAPADRTMTVAEFISGTGLQPHY